MSLGIPQHSQMHPATLFGRGAAADSTAHAMTAKQINGSVPPQTQSKPAEQSDVFLDSPLRYMGFLNEIAAAGIHYFQSVLDAIPSPFKKLLDRLGVKDNHWLKTGPQIHEVVKVNGVEKFVFTKNGNERYFTQGQLSTVNNTFEKKMRPKGGLSGLELHTGHGFLNVTLWAAAIGYAATHSISKGVEAYKETKNKGLSTGQSLKDGLAAFGDFALFHTLATVWLPAKIIVKTQDVVKDLIEGLGKEVRDEAGQLLEKNKFAAKEKKLVRLGLVGVGLAMIPAIVYVLDPVVQLAMDLTYRRWTNRPLHFGNQHGAVGEAKQAVAEVAHNFETNPIVKPNLSASVPAASKLPNTHRETPSASRAAGAEQVYLEPLAPVTPLTASEQTNFLPLLTPEQLANYEVTPHHARAIFEQFV